MNNLFKEGDYVLLSDCEAFDKKYGLGEGTTMWAVARKMEGGEPDTTCMELGESEICIGKYSTTLDIGTWASLPRMAYATQLTVEDVLYHSEDGLTLDELSQIHGAFEKGKEYECVWASNDSCASKGRIYTANGDGIIIKNITCNRRNLCKLKPVTTKPKPEWTPSVGDEVMTSNGRAKIEVVLDDEVCVSDDKGLDVENIAFIKPIDKERERIITKASKVFHSKCMSDYSGQPFLDGLNALYDAGMLKEG